MKDPVNALAKSYSSILQGMANDWTVCSGFVPPTVTGNAILISSIYTSQEDNKSGFDWFGAVTVEFVSVSKSYGYKAAREKAAELKEILDSDNNPNLGSDFTCDTTELASTNELDSINPTDTIFRVILRYEHKISQN